jgi:phosphoribosylformylglycinamidine synthase
VEFQRKQEAEDKPMRVRVFVTLKQGVLDPQGRAVQEALESLQYEGIQSVRVGRLFELELHDRPLEQARVEVSRMCEQLLANLVIEDYSIELPKGEQA